MSNDKGLKLLVKELNFNVLIKKIIMFLIHKNWIKYYKYQKKKNTLIFLLLFHWPPILGLKTINYIDPS